jgi:broad specificity phosphatase PhoE
LRSLILIRHSVPEIRRDVPAAQWRLSDDGIARARELARRVAAPDSTRIFTSVEPKAKETARVLAEEWRTTCEAIPGLHEHERPEAQLMTREAFELKVRELFARPNEKVFGSESADRARRRFTMAVMKLVSSTAGDVVVIAHGTVITLFVAEAAGVEPFAFWKKLEMPGVTRLTLPELKLIAREGFTRPSG